MRFEVPQFIEVEDKIFGPFTWKQFIYLAGGGGIAVVFFLTLPFFFFALFGIPVVALAGFLAFHQVNKRPFSIFLESAIHYSMNKKLYLWKRKNKQTVVAKESLESMPTYVPGTQNRENIASLSRKLEMNTLEE